MDRLRRVAKDWFLVGVIGAVVLTSIAARAVGRSRQAGPYLDVVGDVEYQISLPQAGALFFSRPPPRRDDAVEAPRHRAGHDLHDGVFRCRWLMLTLSRAEPSLPEHLLLGFFLLLGALVAVARCAPGAGRW